MKRSETWWVILQDEKIVPGTLDNRRCGAWTRLRHNWRNMAPDYVDSRRASGELRAMKVAVVHDLDSSSLVNGRLSDFTLS